MHALLRSTLLGMTALILAAAPGLSGAQAPSPRNDLGVAFDHVSVIAPGPLFEQETEFWQKLGGERRQPGVARFMLFTFPDMTVSVRDVAGAGGTVGSTVDHIGFQVPNTVEAIARFQSAGLKTEAGGFPGQGWIVSPTGVRIEILQDPELHSPIRGHHIHFFVTQPLAMQAWYAKNFGAVPGKRGNFEAANITANTTVINLSFSPSETAREPTKGRALARVGFAVNGLDAFLKRLQEQNVTVDRGIELQPDGHTAIAYILDPWGTWIELIDRNAGPAQK
jgi:catechol 2,3-dioxygenase-like lactoylglutathione lyase family enzyme